MAMMAQTKQSAWDARLERINTGRTMTQVSDAEGTIPMQLKRRGEVSPGIRGILAWGLGGMIGWGLGVVAAVVDPAAELVARAPLPEALAPYAPMIESWGDPLIAVLVFMMALGILRVKGTFPRLIGMIIMAYMFALQMNPETPTVAELFEMGQTLLSDEETLAGVRDAVVHWAMQEKA
ncbi:MAG: hypothetical protein MK180_12165 [Rhodobacteraceae bacterium]|nr:hypothetical protein [Paracoccaceae bacterium]